MPVCFVPKCSTGYEKTIRKNKSDSVRNPSSYFGLRRQDIRRLAFQLAMNNNLPHPFSTTTNAAGKKWLKGFMKRHPQLSFHRPQRISVARAQSFTDENIAQFFAVLKPELDKIHHKPSRLFNCDETGITVVQHSSQKVLALKGKREVHKLSSAERGGLITVVMCMSAGGTYIPPMVIFPRKNRSGVLSDNLPADAIVGYSPTGWISTALFTDWFSEFVRIINANEENPAVLDFDGHFSHTRNIDVIDIARKCHVSLVSLPPHTSSKTQPLDVSFMKSFKSNYADQVESWMDSHEGRILTHYSIGALFCEAYEKSATIPIARRGFQKTGIMPYMPTIFEDDPDLLKAASAASIQQKSTSPNKLNPSSSDDVASTSSTSSGTVCIVPNSIPSTSTGMSCMVMQTPSTSKDVSYPSTPLSPMPPTLKRVSPEDIRPVPQIRPAAPSRRRQGSKLISSSPYKKALVAAQDLREKKEAEKIQKQADRVAQKAQREAEKLAKQTKKRTAKQTTKKQKQPPNKRKSAKKLPISESDSECDDDLAIALNDSSSSEDECFSDDDPECQFCGWRYSRDQHGQIWIKCSKCYTWGHEVCDAAVEECNNKKSIFVLIA